MLPLASAHLPATGGRLLHAEAEEILAKQPAGTGDHWWVQVRKDGLGSTQAREAIARSVRVDPALVSDAGNRDRSVRFTQWFSLPAEAVDHVGPLRRAGAHNKLRVLTLTQSHKPFTEACVARIRWTVRLAGANRDGGYLKAKAKLDHLRRVGLPNYVASARMGTDGSWARWGRVLLKGERLPESVLRRADFATCRRAFQESLFNRLVATRLDDGLLDRVLPGDVVQTRAGGVEVVTDPPAMQKRLDSWEATVLGALFGEGLLPAQGEAADREAQLMAAAEVDPGRLAALSGSRRAIRIQPAKVVLDLDRDDLLITCELPGEAAIEWLVAEIVGAEPVVTPPPADE